MLILPEAWRSSLLILVIHGLLVATHTTLIIELRWLVIAATLSARIVHVLHLLLLRGRHLRYILAAIIVDNHLKHLELIFLHSPHMLHLLLVDPLILIDHATVATS